ncbi:MAG: DUF3048 domain-containing protein [Actinomycetota bacterium]
MRRPLAVLLLLLAACSASASVTTTAPPVTTALPTTTAPTTTTEAVTTTTGLLPTSPINGLPVADETLLDRRVMAVKIDNHTSARPQSGIDQAGAVIELPVEGVTRFIALFHHTDSDFLGPVRSGRPSDGPLLHPLGATFAISGGQDWVLSQIRTEGIKIIGEQRPAMFRIRSRSSPHNLYTDTNLLREVADGRQYPDDPPPAMFEFGEFPSGADHASQVRINFGNGFIVTWTYDPVAKSYQRVMGGTNSELVDAEGNRHDLTADTMVVIMARRYIEPAPNGGTSVPAMDTVGRGTAYVLAGGKVISGTWSRDSSDDWIALTDGDGDPLPVPPGLLWISIVPEQNEIDLQ